MTGMAHPNEAVIRRLYDAINKGDLPAVAAEFTSDALWHGGEAVIAGSHAIAKLVGQLRKASGGTLRVELHDVLASDEHAVALQFTRAERHGRSLADRVVYVFHLRDGRISEAWFNGDPRVQEAFWS
jgi:ketosteroid isomerase-like protein